MSIMLVMPFNHLIFCCPLLLLPSVFPSIRVLSNEPVPRIRRPKCWSSSIHHPKIEISLFLFALLNFLARARFWASAILHYHQFSSVQFSHSVVSDSLQPHESKHTRPPCPSPTPGVHPDSRPSSQWCHPAISSSVVPFSSCPQSLPASESFQWVKSSHEVAKVLEF